MSKRNGGRDSRCSLPPFIQLLATARSAARLLRAGLFSAFQVKVDCCPEAAWAARGGTEAAWDVAAAAARRPAASVGRVDPALLDGRFPAGREQRGLLADAFQVVRPLLKVSLYAAEVPALRPLDAVALWAAH